MCRRMIVALVSLGLSLSACKGEKKAPPQSPAPAAETRSQPQTPSPAATPAAAVNMGAQSEKVFKAKCVVCHGKEGSGNGPGSAALNPKPRAFSDPTWQSSATDAQIKKAILEGGAAVGKSAAMPGNPDLRNKPEVVEGLVKIVRGFKS